MSAPSRPVAWGRFGPDDEHGALNLVTPEVCRDALGAVREGRVLSLAQPTGPRQATAPHRTDNARYMMRDAGDYALGARTPDGFRFSEDVVVIGTHNGTHVDALSHAWVGDHLYNGHPASTLRSTTGAQRLGAETLLPVVTRGILLDLVALTGAPLAPSTAIGRDDLERAAALAGVTPRQGDAVLIRTGWWESKTEDYYDDEPGIDLEAAQWLTDADVSLVGADNYAIEVQPSAPGTTFPVHLHLLHGCGIPLMENLDLSELALSRATDFLMVFAPLPLEGSTGSPINPLAVL